MTRTLFTTMRRSTAVRRLLAGLFLTALAGSVALATHGAPLGPVFTSSKSIAEAQAILEKDRYLKAGSYARGELDQATIDAIRNFQRYHFLRPTGQLDPDTMGVLTSHGTIGGSLRLAGAGATGTSSAASDSSAPARTGRAEKRTARQMPQTGSPFVLEVIAGAVLLAGGAVLLRRHAG